MLRIYHNMLTWYILSLFKHLRILVCILGKKNTNTNIKNSIITIEDIRYSKDENKYKYDETNRTNNNNI